MKERPMPFEQQQFEYLQPTPAGAAAFRRIVPDGQPLIAILPRHRVVRRPEKNWPREQYEALIPRLQQLWPEARVAIVGEPGGAHFADGVPAGCVDLINVPPTSRMDIQIAALQQSVMALGGMSGALLVALAAGCPSLIWGSPNEQARYYHENFMGTPMIYYADAAPTVETIVAFAQDFRRIVQRPARPTEKMTAAPTFQGIAP